MDGEDPWYWDIDRVVVELCTESRSWSSDIVRSRRRPNFATLEAALRDQEIDGSTLLTAVDDSVLKNELGIRVLGQLAPVKQIIWDLRQESARYRDWLGRYGSEISIASHVPRNLISAQNVRKRPESPPPHGISRQASPRISPTRRYNGENSFGSTAERGPAGEQGFTKDEWVANATGSKRRRLDTELDPTSPSKQEQSNIGINNETELVDGPASLENGLAPIDDNTAIATTTAEDTCLVDGQAPPKQRKRIAPTNITSEIDAKRNREIPTEADTVINHDPQNIEPGVIYLGDDGKKRLIPIPEFDQNRDLSWRYQEQLLKMAVADRSALYEGGQQGLEAAQQILETAEQDRGATSAEALSTGYLGKVKLPVNDIFYSSTRIGKDLPCVDDEIEGISLSTQGSVSDGRRRYVHGLMKSFLRSKRQIIHRDGKNYYALRPYGTKLAPMHQTPSFTLLRKDDDGVVYASREMVSQWPELSSGTSVDVTGFQDYEDREAHFDLPDNLLLGGPNTYSNWDPDLLEKYRYIDGGDVVLPLYGDSDEEGEYDMETWKEIEEERGTLEKPLLPLKRTPLTHSEVNVAIDEGTAQIVVAWHDKKLPNLQRRAWRLWKTTRRKSRRRELIRKAKEQIERINNERLPQMREEFLRDRWVSKKQVLRVTKIMEPSIFDREHCLWQVSVMKSKDEPARPPPGKSKPVLSVTRAFADNDDGECIMTDTETQGYDDDDDDDDEKGFINDDVESTDEAGLSRADDEADNLTIFDEANSDQSLEDGEIPLKRVRKAAKNLSNGRFTTGKNQLNRDDHMTSISPAFDEDEETDLLQTNASIPPRLPLRLGLNYKGEANGNESPQPKQAFIDLTILTSDTSGSEKSPAESETIDLTMPEKRKNNIRLAFKRGELDSCLNSDVMEVSQGEATDIPHDYLTLMDPVAIARIPRSKWEEAGDKYRLLIGDLFRVIPRRREELSDLFAQLTLTQMWSGMVDVMLAFHDGKDRVQGMDAKTYTGLTGVMRLFETYAIGTSRRSRKKLEPSEIGRILDKEELFPQFHQICRKTFSYLPSKDGHRSDEEDEDPLPAGRRKLRLSSASASDSEEIAQDTPHKTRKNKVFENAQARDLRQQDRQRLLEQEERRRILQDKLARTEFAVTSDKKRIIINDAKHDDQGFIYVNEQISKRIKEHQVDGLRFMWSQIVTNSDVMQGCLLAHTMGLGKTMQVITLLVAIAEAAKSPDLLISSQIPLSLRESKTLVLCPPGLMDNWMDELLMWAPQEILGEYRKFDSTLKTKDVRLDAIGNWYNNGGVLIMSYDMFRKMVHNNSTEKKPAPLDEEEHTKVRQYLLHGPNIIIADEAHKMKNANASITQAATQFGSSARIALTGSPLANNVEEYHTMIEWIAPNYLGPIAEFRAKYVEPIQQGSYAESTSYERRQSLKMLGVLRKDLEPKVHRADISVLRKDLKPKTEFVITVPLTELQHKAYSIYVKSMLGNNHEVTKDGQVQVSTLWHWLAILSLLCNHPACFKAKLSERKDDAEKKIRGKSIRDLATMKALTSEEDDHPGDVSVWKVGVSEELVRQEMDLFKKFGRAVEEFYSSNKVKILLQILDASKEVGDKVLVFSQSIQTLNFLERLCISTGRKYARLDGSTKMSSRQGLTKDFNIDRTELYLISTTAGGIGLNLPGANRVIIFDFKFNPVNEEQAIGRAYRIGQQKPVFVYRFVAGGTFEESIHNTAVFKMQLASKVVDKKNPIAWAKKRTGEFLFVPKDVKQQNLSSFKAMDPFVLDKILDSQEEDSTIRAIVMTDTFERHDHEVLSAEEQQEVLQLLSDEKLKRYNKPAWEALLHKRSLAKRTHHLTQQQPSAAAILTPFHAAQKHGQRADVTFPALAHPPTPPGKSPASSIPSRPSHRLKTHSASNFIIPEMIPVPGANTKIRDKTPPPGKPYPRNSIGSISAPSTGSSDAKKVAHGRTGDIRGSSPSDSFKSLTRDAKVNRGSTVRDTCSVEDLSPKQSRKVSSETSSAPDHKRSLSGDQEGSDAADRLLRVGIMQYSRRRGSVSKSFVDDLAVSMRKEIERIDPTRLKERVQIIIGLLSGNRELADSLVSGTSTVGAIVAMSSLDEDGNLHVSAERRKEVGQEVGTAIQKTLSKVSGFVVNRHDIVVASMNMVKVLADTGKNLEAFEAAKDAMLLEVSNHETCQKLITDVTESRDFAKSLIARSLKPPSSSMDGPSDSPEYPHTPKRSIDSSKQIHRSPQSKTELAYFERVAKRRSRLPPWAILDIEKANTGTSTRQPPVLPKPRMSSHEHTPTIDLT